MLRYTLVLLTVASLACWTWADERKERAVDTFQGVINAVDAKVGTLSLKVGENPTPRDFSFLRDTKVTIDGQPAKIENLKVGMRIKIACPPGVADVQSVAVEGKILKGRLLAVDAAAGTLKVGQEGQVDVVTLTKDCGVFVDGRQANLADLPARGVVLLKYTTAGDKVVSVEVRRGDGDGEKRPPQQGGRRVNTRGVVKSLNPATSELVLTIQGEGRAFDREFTLSKDVAVYDGRTPIKLADIKVGTEITARYTQEGKVIERIKLVVRDK